MDRVINSDKTLKVILLKMVVFVNGGRLSFVSVYALM